MKTKWFEKFKKITAWVVISQMLLAFMPVQVAYAGAPVLAPGATTLVGWTFPASSNDANVDFYSALNSGKTLTTYNVDNVGYNQNGYDSGTDKAATANDWDEGNYWKISFTSTGHTGLTLYSKQRNDSKGPEDFEVEYRVGTGTWFDVPGANYEITNASWHNDGNKSWALPSAVNDKSSVDIRFKVTSNEAATGKESINKNDYSSIDDIFVIASSQVNYTVDFHENGGTAVTDLTGMHWGDLIPEPSITKSGYVLEGWYKDHDFHHKWNFGTDTITGHQDLYAKWVKAYNLTYDGNGNTSGSAPIDLNSPYASNTPVVLLDQGTLAKTGYTFIGWNTLASGLGTHYDVGDTYTTGAYNKIFYAEWHENLDVWFELPTPPNHHLTNAPSFTVAVDTTSTGEYCEIMIDEGEPVLMTLNPVTGYYEYTTSSLSDGLHDYEVTCYDDLGNPVSIGRDITIDTTAPDVDFVDPTPGDNELINDNTPEIRVYSEDATYCVLYFEGLPDGSAFMDELGEGYFGYQFEAPLDEGEYDYHVRCYDEANNEADTDQRTLIIDETPPVLTLIGDPTITLIVGSSFTDPGAEAEDNEDGNITDSIVTSGDTVDPNTVGVYMILYDVSDSAGNAAAQVSRTVRVVPAPIEEVDVDEPQVLTPVRVATATTVVAAVETEPAEEVLGEDTEELVDETANEGDVKGSSDKTCPWWWIIGLVLLAVLGFTAGAVRAEDEDSKIRKYWYAWPPLMGGVAWLLHDWLHNDFKATWWCDNYLLVVILLTLVAEGLYWFLAKRKKNN